MIEFIRSIGRWFKRKDATSEGYGYREIKRVDKEISVLKIAIDKAKASKKRKSHLQKELVELVRYKMALESR